MYKKLISILLYSIFLTLITSCFETEENTEIHIDENLVGTWHKDMVIDPVPHKISFTFNSDGTFRFEIENKVEYGSGKYQVDSSSITLHIDWYNSEGGNIDIFEKKGYVSTLSYFFDDNNQLRLNGNLTGIQFSHTLDWMSFSSKDKGEIINIDSTFDVKSPSDTTVSINDLVYFNATASSKEGDISHYFWSFDEGYSFDTTLSGSIPKSWSLSDTGQQICILRVKDNKGNVSLPIFYEVVVHAYYPILDSIQDTAFYYSDSNYLEIQAKDTNGILEKFNWKATTNNFQWKGFDAVTTSGKLHFDDTLFRTYIVSVNAEDDDQLLTENRSCTVNCYPAHYYGTTYDDKHGGVIPKPDGSFLYNFYNNNYANEDVNFIHFSPEGKQQSEIKNSIGDFFRLGSVHLNKGNGQYWTVSLIGSDYAGYNDMMLCQFDTDGKLLDTTRFDWKDLIQANPNSIHTLNDSLYLLFFNGADSSMVKKDGNSSSWGTRGGFLHFNNRGVITTKKFFDQEKRIDFVFPHTDGTYSLFCDSLVFRTDKDGEFLDTLDLGAFNISSIYEWDINTEGAYFHAYTGNPTSLFYFDPQNYEIHLIKNTPDISIRHITQYDNQIFLTYNKEDSTGIQACSMNGEVNWNKTYPDYLYQEVIHTHDKNIIVLGKTSEYGYGGYGSDLTIIALTLDGERIW